MRSRAAAAQALLVPALAGAPAGWWSAIKHLHTAHTAHLHRHLPLLGNLYSLSLSLLALLVGVYLNNTDANTYRSRKSYILQWVVSGSVSKC